MTNTEDKNTMRNIFLKKKQQNKNKPEKPGVLTLFVRLIIYLMNYTHILKMDLLAPIELHPCCSGGTTWRTA